MPRVGRHPLKVTGLVLPDAHAQISICTVTHIPALDGYWTESLAVLKKFVASLYASTELHFDLLVFDNNSCQEIQDYLLDLRQKGLIQYLILSQYNVRKLGAMDFLFSVAPGDIVSFVDSDVYFLLGWLEKSIEILDTFPEAGMVSAIPTIDKTQKYLDSTLKGIKNDPTITLEKGKDLIPSELVRAHRLSIGKDVETYMNQVQDRQDIRLTRNAVTAYLSAQDFQFITHKKIIDQVLPLKVRNEDEYYDPIYSPVFEAKLDELGYWRLSTNEYLVHHMGNRVPNLAKELCWITGLESEQSANDLYKSKQTLRNRFLKSWIIRKILKRVNLWTYQSLHGE